MKTGDVFRITWSNLNGTHRGTALYLGSAKDNHLWLLCFVCKVEHNDPVGRFLMHSRLDTEMGFSFICKGNLLFGDFIIPDYQIGFVDECDLSEPIIRIWESTESWKMQKLIDAQSPTGIKFWLNMVNPSGKTVKGGFGRL